MSLPVEIVNSDWPGIAASGVIAGLVSAATVLGTWRLSKNAEIEKEDRKDLHLWRGYLLRVEKIFEQDAVRRSAEEEEAVKKGYVPSSVWNAEAFDLAETEYWAMLHATPPRRGTSVDVIRQCLEAEFEYLDNRFGPRMEEKQAYEREDLARAEARKALGRLRACPEDDAAAEARLSQMHDDARVEFASARFDGQEAYRWSAEARSGALLRAIRAFKAASFTWASASRGRKAASEIARSQSRLRYKASHLSTRGAEREGGYWG